MDVRPHNITIKCMLAILLSVLFASCKDEFEEESELLYVPTTGKGYEIGFCADQDGFQKPTTRAGLIEKVNDKLPNLYVLSMMTKDNGATWESVFNDSKNKKEIPVLTLENTGYVDGQIWEYSPKAKWDELYNYQFRAFYPKDNKEFINETCSGFTYPVSNNKKFPTGSTRLTLSNYESATDPRLNTDILVSDVITRNYSIDKNSDAVMLKMKHLLSCVDFKFKAKKDKTVHITSFTVNGYAPKGSCVVDRSSVWTPVWNDKDPNVTAGSTQQVSYTWQNNGANVAINKQNDKYIYKDSRSNAEISLKDLYGGNYIGYQTGDSNYGKFYVVLKSEYETSTINLGTAELDCSKEENEAYEFDNYKGLLFIPQKINREGVDFTMKFSLNLGYIANFQYDNIALKHCTFAAMEFYFGDVDPGPAKRYHATVDLSANGKVTEWEAGIKYVYSISVSEYQATANITIEKWNDHSHKENLR